MQNICDKFNKLDFHDSKLISFCLVRNEQENGTVVESICFEMSLLQKVVAGRSFYKNGKLTFKDCIFVGITLDLLSKRLCADDIASAKCEIASKNCSVSDGKYKDLVVDIVYDHLYFNIKLIPPGGSIDVIAKNFDLDIEL